MSKNKNKIFELVLENCQVIEFDAKDVYATFDIAGYTIWGDTGFVRIKNVLIEINKDAKAVMPDFENEDWKDRIRIPDITNIIFDGVEYSITEYDGEYENKNQILSETESSFLINIRKEVEKNDANMSRTML